MSREHVFPRWLSSVLNDPGEIDVFRSYRNAERAVSHIRPGVPFDQTVRDFCEACNTGWMHELEEEVRALVAPMVRGEATTLDALSQDAVARWGTKTILGAGLTVMEGGLSLPASTFRWFGDHQRPLPSSLVWIGRYEGKGRWPVSFHQHGVAFKRVQGDQPPQLMRDNFHAVCAVGHLVLMLFVAELPEGPAVQGASGGNRLLIWPITGRDVRWPPSQSIADDAGLDEESRRTPDGVAPPITYE